MKLIDSNFFKHYRCCSSKIREAFILFTPTFLQVLKTHFIMWKCSQFPRKTSKCFTVIKGLAKLIVVLLKENKKSKSRSSKRTNICILSHQQNFSNSFSYSQLSIPLRCHIFIKSSIQIIFEDKLSKIEKKVGKKE